MGPIPYGGGEGRSKAWYIYKYIILYMNLSDQIRTCNFLLKIILYKLKTQKNYLQTSNQFKISLKNNNQKIYFHNYK